MAVNTNAVFSVFSFIGFVLCIIPLYWHLEAWNVGTCMFMIWAGLGCLMYFINSVIWDGNTVNWAPVWCDISSRFIIGLSVAIPSATLCINRRLYHIANPTSATTKTKSEKRHDVIVDLSISLGIPFLQMILQYIVSAHRFDIFEDFGCFPASYNTYPAFGLVFAWPLIIGLVAFVYNALTIKAFMKRRKQFKELMSFNTNLNHSRYFRLIALTGCEMVCLIPLASYDIYANVARGVSPWISWEDTHYYYSHVNQYPKIIYAQIAPEIQLTRWLTVTFALVFFGFFGFADEAMKHYRLAYISVAQRIGYTTVSSSRYSVATSLPGKKGFMNSKELNLSTPAHITRESEVSRDSMSSLSDKLSTSIDISETNTLNDTRVHTYTPTDTSAPHSAVRPSSTTNHTPWRTPQLTRDPSSIRKPSVPESVGPEFGLDIA